MGNDESPSALLTKAQRRYLNGEQLSGAEERAIRSRIRQRLKIGFDDLRLILNTDVEAWEDDVGEVLADTDAGRVWPLAALLFRWAIEHPMYTDREDLGDVLSAPGDDPSVQKQIDRSTASFNSQVESGVRAVLEAEDFDRVPREVENELTVSLGPPVSELTEDELLDLPRRTLDLLFRRGDLEHAEYARIMKRRLKSEDEE